jgi:hypothetical protein
MLSVGLADPFSQGAYGDVQFIGYTLDGVCASLPGFAQGLFWEFS